MKGYLGFVVAKPAVQGGINLKEFSKVFLSWASGMDVGGFSSALSFWRFKPCRSKYPVKGLIADLDVLDFIQLLKKMLEIEALVLFTV